MMPPLPPIEAPRPAFTPPLPPTDAPAPTLMPPALEGKDRDTTSAPPAKAVAKRLTTFAMTLSFGSYLSSSFIACYFGDNELREFLNLLTRICLRS
ncbi:MAG: hypothetical protein E5V27_19505 [Mesorhizobium sp.]|nr:MAG: hypothetical protein E5V27_19505 [Mesorhizobium sp.]